MARDFESGLMLGGSITLGLVALAVGLSHEDIASCVAAGISLAINCALLRRVPCRPSEG